MKIQRPSRLSHGFTLIEMLVVIAIIAILAGLLLPALQGVQKRAKIKVATVDIQGIAAAIGQYESDYSRLPVSANAAAAITAAAPDFTFGTYSNSTLLVGFNNSVLPTIQNNSGTGYQAPNSDVIAILMDITNFPAGGATANDGHGKNPHKTSYLNAKQVDGTTVAGGGAIVGAARPGVGPDLVYRDPWGSPYIITLDLNYDNKCRDDFYRSNAVTQISGNGGYNGLSNPTGVANEFVANGSFMIWSIGPDGKADAGTKSNAGVNKDNVLSWQ